ncbi:MAG: hypothetical protein U0103_25695 [Candidatus Obscuribacterales bacterium]
MGSEDYATSNTNPSDDGSSLAARRARLRGTLAKQAAPPDPYKPDPYMLAPAPEPAPSGDSSSSSSSTQSTAMPSASSEPAPSDSQALPSVPAPVFPSPETPQVESIASPEAAASLPVAPAEPEPMFSQVPSSSFSEFTASMFATETSAAVAPANPAADLQASLPAAPSPESVTGTDEDDSIAAETAAIAAEMAQESAKVEKAYGNSGNGSGTTAPSLSAAAFFATAANAVADTSNRTEEKPSFFSEPEVEPVPEPETQKNAAPTGRTDRRRQPATSAATLSPIPDSSSIPPAVDPDSITDLNYMAPEPEVAPVVNSSVPASVPPNSVSGGDVPMSSSGNYTYGIAPQDPGVIQAPTQLQSQAIEIMNNIDQAMGSCAMNLSELQKIASEQTEALKGVAETLQNQSFFEMGLNINTLVDTLAAALEPMKAVGELVPAIDQLVAMMESRETGSSPTEEKLSREQLVTSLAEQLSTGMIDPWTFKCAYMAVFPAEHPADLLHRLVDLLGTQRLSGDLFRSAYDAVQAPDPLPRTAPGADGKPVIQVVQDESLLAQLEELKRTNEEFLRRNEEISKKLEAKDQEFNQVLNSKEQELQEAQELLNSRWEEFNARYDELTETLHKRDEVLQEREAELAKKESENAQLRNQMEELRDQTKEMVADLQRQLSAKPKEEPPKQPGFFDVAPGSQHAPQAPSQPGQLFDAGPSRPLFGQTDPAQAQPQPQPQPQPVEHAPTPAQPAPQPALAQPMAPAQAAQPPGNQAVPRPAAPTTPFVSGAGSYGSGVRAQVFEVIVRQALAGAPWREICAGPMQVNNISPEEVETEVKRRQALLKK